MGAEADQYLTYLISWLTLETAVLDFHILFACSMPSHLLTRSLNTKPSQPFNFVLWYLHESLKVVPKVASLADHLHSLNRIPVQVSKLSAFRRATVALLNPVACMEHDVSVD